MTEMVTVSERAGGKYTNDVKTSRHHLYADEPVSFGSADLGPTPFEYLAAGLGACTTITLRMYADRKKWPMESVSVDVVQSRSAEGKHVFTRTLSLAGDLDETQRERLKQIAGKCPVHKVLVAGCDVETVLA